MIQKKIGTKPIDYDMTDMHYITLMFPFQLMFSFCAL